MQKYQLIVILTHKYLYGGFIIHFFGQKPVPVQFSIADCCQHLGIYIELAKNFIWLFYVRCCSSALLFLTSFETVLLDCIVTAVISVCIKKKSKLVNFCTVILILKIEEKSNIFRILCFIISRKVKRQLKHKNRFVQCVEKVA